MTERVTLKNAITGVGDVNIIVQLTQSIGQNMGDFWYEII